MDEREIWDLAQRSTLKVSSIAARLAREEQKSEPRVFLGRIAAKLFGISRDLDKVLDAQKTPVLKRLPKVLSELERVCTWRAPSQKLNAVLVQEQDITFPTLCALEYFQLPPESVLKAVRNFARGDRLYVTQYFTNLRKIEKELVNALVLGKDDMQTEITGLDPVTEYPMHSIQTLYDTIRRHSDCTCITTSKVKCGSKKHLGRLNLKEDIETIERSEPVTLFDIAFSATPWSDSSEVARWQQLRFQVPKDLLESCNDSNRSASPGTKVVKFVDHHETKTKKLPWDLDDHEKVEPGELCEILGERLGSARICLQILGYDLFRRPHPDEIEQRIIPTSSTSLADLLDAQQIPSRAKLILAYVLARSVWRFYDSDWMKMRWSTKAVHFMSEQRLDTKSSTLRPEFDLANPYLAFDFDADADRNLAECFNDRVQHRYPRILALGIMLIDICTKDSRHRHQDENKSLVEWANDMFTDGREQIKSQSWPALDFRNDEVKQTMKDVASVCFDLKLFGIPLLRTSMNSPTTVQERRAILLNRVVNPLRQLLARCGILNQQGNIGYFTVGNGRTGHQVTGSVSLTTRTASEIWLDGIASSRIMKELDLRYRRRADIPRIRIAILDTGYDSETAFFDGPRQNRIRAWKDWVENSPTPIDTSGHGTQVLSLAMKTAPTANVFIARIAKDANDLATSEQNIAEAIKWATKDCRADIVSMSFGFPDKSPSAGDGSLISKAILQAISDRDGGVLFFAAAANSGANQREMFPASHEYVTSIRATDHDGTFQSTNPPPDFSGEDVFGTLGKDVSTAWLSSHTGEKTGNGCSVATPIAAGIAAVLLGYARLMATAYEGKERGLMGKLWTKNGMRSLFRGISTKMKDKCFYLSLVPFIQLNDEGREDMLRYAARDLRR